MVLLLHNAIVITIIDDKHIGGYNELVEYFNDIGLVNFKGEKI